MRARQRTCTHHSKQKVELKGEFRGNSQADKDLDSISTVPAGIAALEVQLTKKYDTKGRIRRIILLLSLRDEVCQFILIVGS